MACTALKASLGDQGGHVMEAERGRLLDTFFALLARGAALAVDYDDNHPDFQVTPSLTGHAHAARRAYPRLVLAYSCVLTCGMACAVWSVDECGAPGALCAQVGALLGAVGLREFTAQRAA